MFYSPSLLGISLIHPRFRQIALRPESPRRSILNPWCALAPFLSQLVGSNITRTTSVDRHPLTIVRPPTPSSLLSLDISTSLSISSIFRSIPSRQTNQLNDPEHDRNDGKLYLISAFPGGAFTTNCLLPTPYPTAKATASRSSRILPNDSIRSQLFIYVFILGTRLECNEVSAT